MNQKLLSSRPDNAAERHPLAKYVWSGRTGLTLPLSCSPSTVSTRTCRVDPRELTLRHLGRRDPAVHREIE
jgi:hypothetical protein